MTVIEEGPTGVLHQMPTVGDLYRVRQSLCRSFAISATTVTGDDCDRGMSSEPGLGGRRLTIRQQGDYPAPFQIADDAGVPVVAPPCPIINADDLRGSAGGRLRRRATRRSVSLLTGSISRFAKPAAGRPPSAKPR
jgi:hypothetical protein